jgi:glucose-6-phosphate 1-epimerase
MMELDELKRTFSIPGISFEDSKAGLRRIRIQTPRVDGEVYLHGAHVTHFQPQGQAPVLWMSKSSYFEDGKPIRGGVPICFPWFGPHATDSSLPGHGWARLAAWRLVSCGRTDNEGVAIELEHQVGDFQLSYTIRMGTELRLSLTTRLLLSSTQAQTFEDALHTYFAISDIRSVAVEGLESTAYIDKVGGPVQRDATGSPIVFQGETDRVYLNTRHSCRLVDKGMMRTIQVSKSGSLSTVIWNPWIDKSKRMPDFGNDEWERMVCIETANVGDHAIHLKPGDLHTTEVTISL